MHHSWQHIRTDSLDSVVLWLKSVHLGLAFFFRNYICYLSIYNPGITGIPLLVVRVAWSIVMSSPNCSGHHWLWLRWFRKLAKPQLSNEKRSPGCLGHIKNYTTHLCGDYDKPLQGSLWNNQDYAGLFRGSILLANWKIQQLPSPKTNSQTFPENRSSTPKGSRIV